MKCLLIVNPVAGQGRPEESLGAIRSVFDPIVSELVVTSGPGDAVTAACSAIKTGGIDAILVAGGDGTVNEAVNGMMMGRSAGQPLIPLGIIPSGTQNVLASELHILGGNLESLFSIVKNGRIRAIDIGDADSKYFTLMAGFGFDAAVVHELIRPIKDLIGPAAYAFATLGALAKYRSTSLRLILDDEEINSKAYLVVVANASSYAFHQVKLAPFASPDDGWLDVCVFERAPTDKVGFVTQLMAVLARRHLRDPRVRYYRARRIQIDSDPPIQGQLDGDMHQSTPMSIQVIPKILPIFVP